MESKNKHLFSGSGVWQTVSEFVSADGLISNAVGESIITIHENGTISNESRADIGKSIRINNYTIIPLSEREYSAESLNPELGNQTGKFNVDRNIIFSRFRLEGALLNGYEVIRREGDVCYANGALYDGDVLMNTWNAVMKKQDKE